MADRYLGNFNLSAGVTEIKYLRPAIVERLRSPPKRASERKVLMRDAADEIQELREFCEKQARLITRFVSELAMQED